MSDRLTKITEALEAVEVARTQCPFHSHYSGRIVHAVNEACRKCGTDRRGDGGRCVIDHAEHRAVLQIEEVLA